MKQYEVKMVKVTFGRNSTEKLRKLTEDEINKWTAMGFKLFSVDFKLSSQSGYIYSYITLEK